ncbi:MAG: hypothetical protein LBK23_10295, partial [Oscillospiraceae bacterium]|nr:hypothetical protein [Oscillospiraceae bacterium]
MFKHTTRRALSLILTLAAALSIAVTPLTAEAAGKGALTVLPYDSGGSANGGAIVVQSGGKLGLIDKAGKQLVPVEYDNYSCPNNEGYTIFYKGISAIDDWAGGGSSYLFDKSGKKVWESSEKLLYSYTEGVMQIREVVYTHDNGKPFYAVTYQTLDGKIIKAPEKPDDLIYDAVLSATPFLDGTAFLIYPEVYNTYTNDEGAVRFAWDSDYTKVLDINGTLETLADDYVTYYAASAGYTIARWSDTDSYGLYSLKTRSFFGPHCGFSYEWRRNPDTNGVKVTNFGTLAIFRLNEYSGSYFPAVPEDKLNGKLYLFDFAQPPVNVTVYGSERQTMIPISGGYDYIFPSATEKWFQISPDGERWGYVSRDGKTEKFFDD